MMGCQVVSLLHYMNMVDVWTIQPEYERFFHCIRQYIFNDYVRVYEESKKVGKTHVPVENFNYFTIFFYVFLAITCL